MRGSRPAERAEVEAAIATVFHEEWGRLVAALIRRTGDWDLAEECVQQAFEQAAVRWPQSGVPRMPGAWLTTVAGNAAIDRIRRAARGRELLEEVGRDADGEGVSMQDFISEEPEIEDDRLRLIFTCCHPALALEARVALTLRAIAGLTTAEIGRAFLVPEGTMAKRLTRAKGKIAAAGIPYRVPQAEDLPERLSGVLAVLYLLFNEGYLASSGDTLVRRDLTAEAIRITRLLASLMPDEPEVRGLLALMLFNDSRRAARVDARGDLVVLEEQDRSLWDRAQITEAVAFLDAALRGAGGLGGAGVLHGTGREGTGVGPTGVGLNAFGPYVIQAAIAACHASARSPGETDWPQIRALYELLLVINDTPVVRLNHAVAVALSGELSAALAELDALEPGLATHYLFYATRADLRRRAALHAAAAASSGAPSAGAASSGSAGSDLVRTARADYLRALELVPSEPERRYLQRRLRELDTAHNSLNVI